MSDLLNKASLVVIPSGYKEDTVYSVVPTDGSGDLSFTRASNGTRVNSAGLVEVCPWNLVQQSETFDNATWTKDGLTVTTNTTVAPNGTTTADTFTEGSASGQHRIYQVSAQSTNIYTISVYVKNITGTRQAYIDLGPVTGFFNFASETTYSALGIASFENVGNGWYRFSLTTANAITPSTIYMGLGQSNSETYTGNGTSAIAFWGAQLNIGTTAKPYFPTTDRLNVPRLTYQNGGGGCPSLLLEKQSTNLNLYSEDFSNAVYTLDGITVTANATTSPDGTQNADKLVANAVSGDKFAYQVITTSLGSAYTASAYFKASEYTYAFMRLGAIIGDPYIIYNLATQAVVSTSSLTSYSITSVGNGWYRITATATATTVVVAPNFMIIPSSGYTLGGDNIPEFTGNGSNGGFIWGAQLEQSSYATSYIGPTTSSSATRVADACFKTGISSLIGQTEGVLFVDFTINALANFGTPLSVNDGSTANYIWLTIFANGNLRAELFNSSGVQATITYSGAVVGGRYKMAFAYKTNDFAMYVNGSQVGIATSGTTFSGTTLSRIDNDITSPALYSLASQKINQTALFKTRLTNAELASLTTI